jgi:hypothetical protein
MGTAAGGLIIRTSKGIDESYFSFSDRLTKTSYCDSRKSNCFYFGRKEGILAIVNSDLSNRMFTQNKIEETLFNFFDKPDEIFVFEEYDSGASYGYGIFKNGQLIRKVRTENYNDIAEEFGEPLKEELEWLNGQKSNDSDGNLLIRNAVNGHEIPEDYLYKAILQLLMQNKFSFTCETMDDEFIESGYYIITERTENISTGQSKSMAESKSESRKKWWKLR